MAQAPLKKCATPGCNQLIRGQAHCEAHAKRARAKTTDRFYLSTAWRKLRERYLQENPLCADCEAIGRAEPAYICDHVVERADDPSLELEWSNLRGLCLSHHNSKTARERVRRRRGG